MKKSILSKWVVIVFILFAFGCKTRQKAAPVVAATPPPVKASFDKKVVLKSASDKQINFNTLLIKAKADININDNKNDVNMNIRMQDGKAIWISASVSVIGEVARALITPDSIKIINKLQSTYTRKPFSYIYEFTNKQVNFTTLQDLLIGNAIEGTVTSTSTVDINGEQTRISGALSNLVYLMIFNQNYNLVQSNLKDKVAAQTLTVDYGDHRQVKDQQIPHSVSIRSIAAKKSITLDLKYNYVGLNESVDFPFSVSKRYTVKD